MLHIFSCNMVIISTAFASVRLIETDKVKHKNSFPVLKAFRYYQFYKIPGYRYLKVDQA